MANLSDRIKSLRLSAEMTQEEFGKKFGIVKSTVSLYESGKSTPNDQIKKQICDYFHVSLDYFNKLCHTKAVLTTAERHIHRQSVLEYISYTDFGGLYNIYTGFAPLYSHIFSPHFGQITNFFTSVVSSLSSGISCCG